MTATSPGSGADRCPTSCLGSLLLLVAIAFLVAGCATGTRQQAARHIQDGNYGLAEPLLRKALDQYSLDWNAYLQLGQVYRHTGRLEQSRLVFQQIARKNPDALVTTDTSQEFAGRRVAELANAYLMDMGEGPMAPDLLAESQPQQPFDKPDSVASLEEDILLRANREGEIVEVEVEERLSLEVEPVQRGLSGQGYGVHVLSFRRALNVEDGREQLLKRFPQLMAGKEFRSRRVDIPGKGVYHRLITGPYATRAQASQICSQLKRAYGYCEVVDF